MADSLSISPVALSGLAGIPSVAFQLLTTGTRSTASTSSIFSSSSNVVELSSSGQLLSAIAAFRSNLETQQANAAGSNPPTIASTAQSLVEAFNSLQTSTGSLQTVFAALSGNTLATQFTLTLNELATQSITANSANLSSLQSIGISLQATPAPTAGGTTFTLNIDQNQLTAAINNDPAGTRAVLAGATQSFIDLAGEFESEVARATVSLTNLTQLGVTSSTPQIDLSSVLGLQTPSTVQGIGIATGLLQNLDADTVLTAIRLADLDLAAVGVDASTLLSDERVLRGALAVALLAPSNALTGTANPPLTETNDTTDLLTGTAVPAIDLTAPSATGPAILPDTTTEPATAASATATAPAAETPVATAPAIPAASTATADLQSIATSAALAAATEALAADRRASEATLALQSLLADPGQRAINNLFDPAYAALIAASHLSDFVPPDPVNNPDALAADAPAPVLAVPPPYGIAYYNEAAGETWKLYTKRGDPLQWFA